MPRIIYGTAWKKERTEALVIEAVNMGFRGIDTACQPKHYHEAGVGIALQKLSKQGIKRESLYLQTKFTPLSGQDPKKIPYDQNASLTNQVLQSFEISKSNLKTNYVDSLLLHSPLFPFSNLMEVWKAMESIVESGGALQLGISNCYDLKVLERLYKEAKVKPDVVQNRFYTETDYDLVLRLWCKDKGIIYQSFWSLTANPHILTHNTIKSLGAKYKRTASQIFFRFLIQIDIVPLTGTTSETHMKDDMSLFDFELDDDEAASINLLLL
ncbi:MAG: aldo/keto reductase [Sulfurovum sp.]|nr:aldo/keto reductase [Sulfurovum sp.]